MNFPHRVTIVAGAAGADDSHGNPTEDWGAGAARTTDVPAWLQQQTSSETHDPGRNPVDTSWLVFLPVTLADGTDTPIGARSRVEWHGQVFAVAGDPNVASTPRGPHHIEVALELVTG